MKLFGPSSPRLCSFYLYCLYRRDTLWFLWFHVLLQSSSEEHKTDDLIGHVALTATSSPGTPNRKKVIVWVWPGSLSWSEIKTTPFFFWSLADNLRSPQSLKRDIVQSHLQTTLAFLPLNFKVHLTYSCLNDSTVYNPLLLPTGSSGSMHMRLRRSKFTASGNTL